MIDLDAAIAQQAGDVRRRAVPQPDPDHFRRCPVEDTEPLKVFILGYDYEPVVAGVLPDRTIGTTRQTSVCDVDAAWVHMREFRDKPRGEILVAKSSICCSAGGDTHYPPFALRGKRQAGADVVARQLWKIGQDPLLAHTGGKVGKHVTDRDARSSHARLTEPNFGVYDDPITMIHRSDNR